MKADAAEARDVEHALRHDLGDVGEHAQIGLVGRELARHLRPLQRPMLMHGNGCLEGARLERVRLATRDVGRAVDGGDVMPARAQAVEDLLGKRSLADEENAHGGYRRSLLAGCRSLVVAVTATASRSRDATATMSRSVRSRRLLISSSR